MIKNKLIIAGAASAVLASAVVYTTVAGPNSTEPEPIDDAVCLRKMSLDLTYRGPTTDEVAELQAGTATLADMADRYMATPEFELVVFDWYRQQFPLTEISPPAVDYEEPSRIAQFIVIQDRDYREIMTGDYTITPEGAMEPVTDRPPAGVISTQHYMSAFTGSFRRNWAGHFLKEWSGIVLEPIALPPEAEDLDLSPSSILTDPSCAGCHGDSVHGVDHLAALAACYDEDGNHVAECASAPGSFLDVDADGIQGLGQVMADSKEWKSQSVNFFYKKLFGRALAQEEADFYVEAVRAFQDAGFSAKALIRHLVTSQAYCAN